MATNKGAFARRLKNERVRQSRIRTDDLRDAATTIRAEGVNHRGFKVGAAALCMKRDGSFGVVVGHNYKPTPKMDPRVCAEEMAMVKAKDSGYSEVVGMVITAPHQPDDASAMDLGVTISCVFCRRMFAESIRKRGLIKRTTWLIFVNAETGQEARMTVEKLLRIANGHKHKH